MKKNENKKLIPLLNGLHPGLHVEIEICPDRTIFRIKDGNNRQHANIVLHVDEKHVKDVEHSKEFEDFKVFSKFEK